MEKQTKPASATSAAHEPVPVLTEEEKKAIQVLHRLARENAAEPDFSFLGLTTST
jgi:hypothetical protein